MTCSFAFSSFCRAQHLLLTAEYSHLNHPSQFYNLLSLSISYTKELARLQSGNGWAHSTHTEQFCMCSWMLLAAQGEAPMIFSHQPLTSPEGTKIQSRALPTGWSSELQLLRVTQTFLSLMCGVNTGNKVKLHPAVPETPMAMERWANTPGPGLHHKPRFCHI